MGQGEVMGLLPGIVAGCAIRVFARNERLKRAADLYSRAR